MGWRSTGAAAALAACAALGGGGARADGAPPAARAPSQFCVELERMYGQLILQPGGRRPSTDAITYAIYRNSTAERLVVLGWAGGCDLSGLLSMEDRHMRDAMASQPPSSSALDVRGGQ